MKHQQIEDFSRQKEFKNEANAEFLQKLSLIVTDFGEARGFFRGIGQYDSGQEDETDVPARNIR
ncbi:Uncharacterized protein dnm_024380 [Desulfonema magnum]|uniref:Uncharacterized protein n=1 Tax=Desulfonema magnum TaxID=45655 RepID=A0A975GM84_9BACT|nr:Uncharacterized protein dnm_024380 [Desulfonema magnum]